MTRDDTTWDPEATVVPPTDAVPDNTGWLVGRYAIGPLLGRGGSGQVHRATDQLTDQDVAIKFVIPRGPAATLQLRRELTALRLLDLPGVVRLLDDGEDSGQTFLVMDLLPGGRFDSLATGGWSTWSNHARSFLEALARLHFAGVLHRDLKPSNVLLDAAGRPVILDFGLAQGRAVGTPERGRREGSPRYMAPEQHRGEACDERTDLYAVGRMFAEMLEGHDDAPASVQAVVRAMQSPDPADRPDSVLRVLDALGADPHAVLGSVADLPEVSAHADLAALFDEPPTTFLHLAHDAASVLLARTEGAKAQVQAEVNRWVRAGRAHWRDGRLVIDRGTVDRLLWEQDPAGPTLAALARRGDPTLAAAAQAQARALHARGASSRAIALLEAVLPAIPVGDRIATLILMTDCTLSLQDLSQIRRAQYRAEAAEWNEGKALLRGARAALTGDTIRAEALLAALPPLEDEDLECWRLSLWLHALARSAPDRQEERLTHCREWAMARPQARIRWWSWAAGASYSSGDFDQAARLYQRILDDPDAVPVHRLMTIMGRAAAAYLETDALSQAKDLALRIRRLAQELRFGRIEGQAAWLLRAALYRQGLAETPRLDLVDAAAAVSPSIEAQLALTEAAIAWRSGAIETARALAQRSAMGFRRLSFRHASTLAGALAVRCGASVETIDRLDDLDELPAVFALQIAALVRSSGEAVPLPPRRRLLDWHLADPRARLDVLSRLECEAALWPQVRKRR